MAERVLVVADETTLGANIQRALERAGHSVVTVETGRAAMAELDRSAFDVVVSDLRLPDVDGLTVLGHARRVAEDASVIVMTAHASIDAAVEALRRGAQDYILKPLTLADLVRKVQHLGEHRRLGLENARLRSLVRGDAEPLSLLRQGGAAMRGVCDLLQKAGPSTSTVLVHGESGTGKELVARALHDVSPRHEGPFVTLDVSAIPDTLVESYLFGHERGAFTGADRRREGLFRAASSGTLFLDEIAELPLAVQAKLLRAVETKEVLPVGSDRAVKVDARIVVATHRDLAEMADKGLFRRDLLYRLSVITIRVPPLRERLGDIPQLARTLVRRHAREQRKRVDAVDPAALALLARHPWPGNVRELSNVLERAVLLCEGGTVLSRDLPLELNSIEDAESPRLVVGDDDPLADEACDLSRAVLGFERKHIARVLTRTKGNRDAAARLLGLSPATLYRHLQRVGLKGFRPEGEET